MKSTLNDKSRLQVPILVTAVSGFLLSFQLGWAQREAPVDIVEQQTGSEPVPVDAVREPAPLARSLGASYKLSSVQKGMDIGEERGHPSYEKAAKPLRESRPQEYHFRGAKLADVFHLMMNECGIDYVSDLDSQAAGERMITFSMTKASPFSALESLAKHFKVRLTYDHVLWHASAIDRTPVVAKASQRRWYETPTMAGASRTGPIRLEGADGDSSISLFNRAHPEATVDEVRPPTVELPGAGGASFIELPVAPPVKPKKPLKPAKPVQPRSLDAFSEDVGASRSLESPEAPLDASAGAVDNVISELSEPAAPGDQ